MSKIRSRSLLSVFVLALCATPVLAQEAKPADVKKLVAAARDAINEGDFAAAAANFRKVVKLTPDDGTSWQLLGYSLHALGELDEALPIHKKAAEFPGVAAVASYNVACVYALRGDKDQALTWLEKAAAAGFDRPEHIENDTDMDALRGEARFKAAVEKISGQAGPDRLQVFAMKNDRKCARVAWFGRNGSPGQIAIDYSPVPWLAKYDEMAKSEKMLGKKWRLGADFWTSLDTSLDLSFGGTPVPAGYYYLTLEQKAPGEFVLGVHDAQAVKKMQLDAFQADQVRGGIEVALSHGEAEDAAEQLSIGIKLESGSQNQGEFSIRFGGHVLAVPVKMKIGSK